MLKEYLITRKPLLREKHTLFKYQLALLQQQQQFRRNYILHEIFYKLIRLNQNVPKLLIPNQYENRIQIHLHIHTHRAKDRQDKKFARAMKL